MNVMSWDTRQALIAEKYERQVSAAIVHARKLLIKRIAQRDVDEWLRTILIAHANNRHETTRIFWLHRQERNTQEYARCLSIELGPLFSVDLVSSWRQNPRISVSWNLKL